MRQLLRLLLPSTRIIVVLASAVGIWGLLSLHHVFPRFAVPSPSAVWEAFLYTWRHGYLNETMPQDLLASLTRVTVGFFGAVVVGVPLGLAMAESRIVHSLVDPFLQLGRPVPPLAYIPLFVVWFGLGEFPKDLLIAVGTLPVIVITVVGGVRKVPQLRYEVARSLGATRRQLFTRVTLPSVLPDVFTAMRVGIGVAWGTLVAAELIAASVGLGWLVEQAANQLQTAIVMATIIVIGLTGYAMELLIRIGEYFAVPWRGRV